MSQQQLPQVLVDYAWYADGVGKVGLVPKIKLPDFAVITEEYSASGMAADVDIDMGMIEKLVSTVTLAEPDPGIFKQFGLANGQEKSYVFRSALQGRGEVVPFTIFMQARIMKLNMAEIERKKISTIDLELSIASIRIMHGADELMSIDVEAGKWIVGGVDRRAGINAALGI